MKTDAYNLFKSMFLILDKMWQENQDEELRIYLSDADPMFCENGTSSNPAVFEEFEKMYNEKKTEDLSDYGFYKEIVGIKPNKEVIQADDFFV